VTNWYGNGMNGWGSAIMIVTMIAPWVIVVVGAVVAGRFVTRGNRHMLYHQPDATRILAERFARGELDDDEYQHKLEILRDAARCTPTEPRTWPVTRSAKEIRHG
jgi:putative membrane protein